MPIKAGLAYLLFKDTHLALDFSNKSLKIRDLKQLEHQKWHFVNGFLENSFYAGKALVVVEGTCCELSLEDKEWNDTLKMTFENGEMRQKGTGAYLDVDENQNVVLLPFVSFRQTKTQQPPIWTARSTDGQGEEEEIIKSCTSK